VRYVHGLVPHIVQDTIDLPYYSLRLGLSHTFAPVTGVLTIFISMLASLRARCWLKLPMQRPTFAVLQGAINLLLSMDADELRAKVAAAKVISTESGTTGAWEVPMRGWTAVAGADGDGSGGTFGDIAAVTTTHYKYNTIDDTNQSDMVSKEALGIAGTTHISSEQLKAAFGIVNDIRFVPLSFSPVLRPHAFAFRFVSGNQEDAARAFASALVAWMGTHALGLCARGCGDAPLRPALLHVAHAPVHWVRF
jgi:hypothetical protein